LTARKIEKERVAVVSLRNMREVAMVRAVEWSRVLRIRPRTRTNRKHDLYTDEKNLRM